MFMVRAGGRHMQSRLLFSAISYASRREGVHKQSGLPVGAGKQIIWLGFRQTCPPRLSIVLIFWKQFIAPGMRKQFSVTFAAFCPVEAEEKPHIGDCVHVEWHRELVYVGRIPVRTARNYP
jgi:hypothetical protein